MSRIDAVIETYRRVGPAMMQTAFVGGLGMFVFALSTFTPTQRFGMLMLVLLLTALLGDLILLPALLAGPLGRWFRPRGPLPVAGSPIMNPLQSAGESKHVPESVWLPSSHDIVIHPGQSGVSGPQGLAGGNLPAVSRTGEPALRPSASEPAEQKTP